MAAGRPPLHLYFLGSLIALPLSYFFLVFFLGECGRWERQEYSTPWVAPGRQVTPYFKQGSDPGLGRAEWRDTVREQTYNPYRLADRIGQFMLQHGMFEQFFPTQEITVRDKQPIYVMVAPFRFTLVSVDPMVVLMTPYPFGPDTRRDQMPGYGRGNLPGIARMRNTIELGTTTPYAEGMQLFLPERDSAPAPVRWQGSEANIPLGNGETLVLARHDSVVQSRRVAAGR